MLYTSHSHSRYHRTLLREKGWKPLHLTSFCTHSKPGTLMLDESFPGRACFPQDAEEAYLVMSAWLGYLQGRNRQVLLGQQDTSPQAQIPCGSSKWWNEFHLSSVYASLSIVCMFTFQGMLSSGTGGTSKTNFTSRQHVQWLLNTHCSLYSVNCSHIQWGKAVPTQCI